MVHFQFVKLQQLFILGIVVAGIWVDTGLMYI